MKVIITKSYEEMSRVAADILSHQLTVKPKSVLGLATGSTPIGLYQCLVSDYEAKKISFAQARTFNLDEYRGLNSDHNQSYRYFMQQNLFDHVDVRCECTAVPDGSNPDASAACEAYEEAIAQAGGIDIQLLGLGHNGHIGFNEPDTCFPQNTHIVELAQSTIEANSRLFDSIEEVPREAYTMGIGTIMAAREVLVIVSGSDKAEIVRQVIKGPVTPEVPASILQFHPCVTFVLEAEAAALLSSK